MTMNYVSKLSLVSLALVSLPACRDVHSEIGSEVTATAGAESGDGDASPQGAGESGNMASAENFPGDEDAKKCDEEVEGLKPAIVKFCELQGAAGEPPAPGEVGASCSAHEQCDEGQCLWTYSRCSVPCSSDDACPFGFTCDDVGIGMSMCVQASCDVPTSIADCIETFINNARSSCWRQCSDEFSALLECATDNAPVCRIGDGCEVEDGLLRAC